jgi:hypothetical protein
MSPRSGRKLSVRYGRPPKWGPLSGLKSPRFPQFEFQDFGPLRPLLLGRAAVSRVRFGLGQRENGERGFHVNSPSVHALQGGSLPFPV